MLLIENTTISEIKREHPDMESGGVWQPTHCQSRWRIALIIPLRDREEHLKIFIRNIIPFLKKQEAHFTIFAIEEVSILVPKKIPLPSYVHEARYY